jgi:hypothetical protein
MIQPRCDYSDMHTTHDKLMTIVEITVFVKYHT